MKVRFALLTVLALLVFGSSLVGQRRSPEPNPLGQPLLDAQGHVRDDAFIRIPLAAADARYADIDGDRMKAELTEFVAISAKNRASGDLFWGRNVGTSGHADAEDWVERRFRKAGLVNIHRETFDLRPQWVAKSWEVTFTAGGAPLKLVSARIAAGMTSTPSGGTDLDLVWAGLGSAADFAGRDVKGKAVLIQDLLTPGVLNHSIIYDGAVDRAFQQGAAAVGVVYGIADNFALWERAGGKPGFNVGYEDGKRLRDLLGEGKPVRVHLAVQSEMQQGLKTASVIGVLPGASSPGPGDEEIIVMAHIDGYFDGALDNGSGVVSMMGLLDHFAKIPRSQRRRSIRFIGSAGHHGGPGAAWLHERRETELAKTALMVNLEHVAVVRTKYWGPHLRMSTEVSPMRWWVNGSPALMKIAVQSFARFNVGIIADMDDGASGEMGQVARDAPSIQVISSPEVKHTEQDTAEWVPAAGLEQVTRAYARIFDEMNKLDRSAILPVKGEARPSPARQ